MNSTCMTAAVRYGVPVLLSLTVTAGAAQAANPPEAKFSAAVAFDTSPAARDIASPQHLGRLIPRRDQFLRRRDPVTAWPPPATPIILGERRRDFGHVYTTLTGRDD